MSLQVITTGSYQLADPNASASSLVQRDGSGNILAVQVKGSELASTGTFVLPRVSKVAAFTADGTSTVYACDATAASFSANLPPAATVIGRIYTIKKITAANTVTITGNGAELIDAANTLALTTQYSSRTVISNGTNWEVIASV
jgi:hypothetical protein